MIERVKYSIGLFLVLFGFFYSYNMGLSSFDGEIYVNIQELIKTASREIANVQKLTKPKGTLLLSTSPLRLLTDARLNEPPEGTAGPIEIILGHFSVTTANKNTSIFACQFYDEIILNYEAAIPSSSEGKGESTNTTPAPLMRIKTPCTIDSKDLLHLKAILIIPQKIKKEPPGDGMRVSDDGSYSIHFENMNDEWPSYWHFKSVQLKASKTNSPIKEMARSDLSLNEQSKLDINWMH